ncbi:prepilin peptidase [Dickeya chrysanthemi]|uniref:A24 family peptidase n=1 Tax=Dickeya chrysanthemi TaxID=556 RepID=UPI001CF5D957|nr:prepilin peptidase [Dickeya chrysanthemi]
MAGQFGVQYAYNLLLVVCLVWCIGSDLLLRRIPNRAVLALLLGWLALSALATAGVTGPLPRVSGSLLQALPGALLVFVVGFLLFLTGRLGAGDVKLMSVLCLWVGYGHQISFVMMTAIAGGILALSLPLLNTCSTGVALLIERMNHLLKINITPPPMLSAELSQGIPYGIAIAFGAAYILIWPQF